MVTAKLSGTMEKYTKESMKMTKSMDSVHLVCLISENKLVNGNKENNMVKEHTYYKMAVEDMENGSKVRELDGLTRITLLVLMTLNEKNIYFQSKN